MATQKKPKRERYVSPVGEAKWAHLHSPKAPFQQGGQPRYQVDFVFDPNDPEAKAWAGGIEAERKRAGTATLFKPEKNEQDQPTGRWFVTLKTGEQYPPQLFDAQGQALAAGTRIGNGSKIRCAYTIVPFSGFGGGVTLYLSAVQVVELRHFDGRTASDFGFPVEEGGGFDMGDPNDAPPPEDDLVPF